VLADNQEIAYAVRKTSPQLRRLLDEFLADHRLGTSFGDTVWRRYLANNRWVKNPTATIDRKRVAATIDLFRRYAGDFDLDYLLLMAQAYQESQLRQDLRSPAGAVGVMQIKPATAAAPPILIRNVSTVANNIRAGAKYLRHLEDTRFADANLTPFNRQVFALAAYNAGAGRVASLRRAARDQGLDPGIWFENVELEAARAIGAETTTYVRNILKYYVTYQLTIRTGQPPVDR
jgi:membrane-bound lytic murein transglycosylase MltF